MPSVPPALLVAVLSVVVSIGAGRSSTRLGAGAWGVVGAAVYLPVALTLQAHPPWVEGVVAVMLLGLAAQAHAMNQRVANALTTSEVARRKLTRSNAELGSSMQEVEAALTKLNTIVDNLAEGLVAASVDGHIEIANAELARLLDSDDIAAGADVSEVLPPKMRALVAQCLETEGVVKQSFDLGQRRSAMAVASPIRLNGVLWGTVVLVRDITLQREIDRMKSDFAATVSHEMRTPLTSVLGFTKIIGTHLDKRVFPALPADDKRAQRAAKTVRTNLDIISTEGERLTRLINDVLDLSKIESGQMEWDIGTVAPALLMHEAEAATQALVDAKEGVQLVWEVDAELPDVRADTQRIVQVLCNLIDNAVKFTRHGDITVRAHRVETGVAFSVADPGLGISAVNRPEVFEKFKQVGDILTDRPSGTGLGLPISKAIVLHHGGRIWVDSQVDVGSTFTFVLSPA